MKLKISRTQYFTLIPNIIYCKAIGITSGVMIRASGIDAWISMLIGFLIAIVAVLLMVYLGSKFPDKTMIEYSQVLLGKWAGKSIGLLLSAFFIVAFALSADVLVLHLKEYFLVDTPTILICATYVLLCMYGVPFGVGSGSPFFAGWIPHAHRVEYYDDAGGRAGYRFF